MEITDYCSYELSKSLIEAGYYCGDISYIYNIENKSLCEYELAYLLQWKEDEYIPAIPLYLVQKWLRNVHNIDMDIKLITDSNFPYSVTLYKDKHYIDSLGIDFHATYEKALEAGIKFALNYI